MFVLFLAVLLGSQASLALSPSVAELSENLDSVVQIRNYAPDHTGNDAPAFCVGTLLSPKTLITAAHCVKDLYFHPEMTMQIDLGHYRYVNRPNGERVRVGYATSKSIQTTVSIRFLPELTRKLASRGKRTKLTPNDDVAVVYLHQALPVNDDFIFASVLPTTLHTAFIKTPLNYVIKVTTINFIEESSTDVKRSASLNNLKTTGQHLVSRSVSRVAPGDSGAPLFVMRNNQAYLAAVVKGRGETIFSNWDVYTLVHKLVCSEERLPGCY